MVARKYSASMDEELLEAVRAAAEEADETLSAFLAEAARRRVHLLVMERELDAWEHENGAFTEEELAEARDWLDNVMTPEEARSDERERQGEDRSGGKPKAGKRRRSA